MLNIDILKQEQHVTFIGIFCNLQKYVRFKKTFFISKPLIQTVIIIFYTEIFEEKN